MRVPESAPVSTDQTIPTPPGPRDVSLLTHDIRSAMADVIGGLRLIDTGDMDPETRAQMERVRSSGEVLARLVDDALETLFATDATAGRHIGNLHLGRFLHDLESRWVGRAAALKRRLQIESATDLPPVISTDRVALDRILANLLSNALKYAGEGGVRLQVTLQPGGVLRFRVNDDGPGFSDAALARLFEFAGRPEGQSTPGSGLGLHIAKGLADALGGRLSVSNGASGGAEVTLTLPKTAWDTADAGVLPEDLPDLAGLKVLVAEDNATNQALVSQMLDTLGAEHKIASDGIEALDWLDREDFDFALVDIEMPRLNGIDVIRAVRARKGKAGRVPMIALTAYVLKPNRDAIYDAGADGIIAKPIMDIGSFGRALKGFHQRSFEEPIPPLKDTKLDFAKPIDCARMRELMDIAGPEASLELLDRLMGDLDRVRRGLESGCRTGKADQVRADSHVLISLAGAIGADGLHHCATVLNAAAHRRDTAVMAETGLRTDPLLAATIERLAEKRRKLS